MPGVNFTVYSIESGDIRLSGHASSVEKIEAQMLEGEAWMPGYVSDCRGHVVRTIKGKPRRYKRNPVYAIESSTSEAKEVSINRKYLRLVAGILGTPELQHLHRLKASEASAILAGDESSTPLLTAEAEATGVSRRDLSRLVLLKADREASEIASIEASRRQALTKLRRE